MVRPSPEQTAQYAQEIFTQRLIGEVVPPNEVTDRLELTRLGIPVEGVRHPLLDSVRGSHWFSIEGGRIYIELRNPAALEHSTRKIRAIKGVDFDDCLASATNWHKNEYRLVEEQFGVPEQTARNFYEMSKVIVPGKAVGEKRYTPRLNLALLTAYTDLLGRKIAHERAFEEVKEWKEIVSGLIQQHGEVVLVRQAVDPKILDVFTGNFIADYLYRDFADAVFDPKGSSSLRFIATRGKIEGPLGQVYKVHSSGVTRRNVDLVVYTNDIKAETLIYLSSLLPEQVKEKPFYLFDDNTDEIVPYLDMASQRGMDNIWVVQVSHPDAKRKGSRIDLEPARVIGREGNRETVLRYYSLKQELPISRTVLFHV